MSRQGQRENRCGDANSHHESAQRGDATPGARLALELGTPAAPEVCR